MAQGNQQNFEGLTNELAVLNNQLGTQGINHSILHNEGDPRQFKVWLKEVVKYSVLIQAN